MGLEIRDIYITGRRVSRAKKFLLTTDYNQVTVCLVLTGNSNFNSDNYFKTLRTFEAKRVVVDSDIFVIMTHSGQIRVVKNRFHCDTNAQASSSVVREVLKQSLELGGISGYYMNLFFSSFNTLLPTKVVTTREYPLGINYCEYVKSVGNELVKFRIMKKLELV